MARSSECTEQYAHKVLDSADIVRDAWLRKLSRSSHSLAFPLWLICPYSGGIKIKF